MDKRLAAIVRDWAEQNKKSFWKYEVSYFHKTYKIIIGNLPNPSKDDITVSPQNGLLNQEKTQLCTAIKKALSKAEGESKSRIDFKIDYVNGAVVATTV